MGVERMGDDSPEADAEILAMTVECLLATGLTEFQVSVGQVDYYKAIFAQTGLSQEEEEELRELISQKNYFGHVVGCPHQPFQPADHRGHRGDSRSAPGF